MENVRWKPGSNKKHFARSADNSHFDHIDALLFLIRHIIYTKNPYPPGYDLNMKFGNNNNYIVARKSVINETKKTEIFNKMLNVKKVRKNG